MDSKSVQKELHKKSNKEKAKILQGFFKTKKGEYGEGDIFLGVVVPEQREIAKKYQELNLIEIQELLKSKYHEERLTALIVLTYKYEKTKKETEKKEIYEFYLSNTKYINNWDLVDLSAPKIVGNYLLNHKNEKNILYKLAKGYQRCPKRQPISRLWEKRISILATFPFIKANNYEDSIKLSEMFLYEEHDLMHKAVGWMLREVGKKDEQVLINFLDKHYKEMPRTMLRYSIEKFDEEKRNYYLKK